MKFYLTYAEPPSGVFSSQVMDVIHFLNKEIKGQVRLIAFISLHDFSSNKKKIKKELPNSIVLPMLPKATFWRINAIQLWILCLIMRPTAIIARNVIAANMALKIKNSTFVKAVCFDGRGAIAAEWKEYDVNVVESWKREIDFLEQRAVIESDFRIAVTEKLVDYWNRQYGYASGLHVVIPCTLNSAFQPKVTSDAEKIKARESLGINSKDVVLAYSGSTAGWQSFSTLQSYLSPFLKQKFENKVLFLSKPEENIQQLEKEFPGQIIQKWVSHHDVPSTLSACDMGILIREDSVTNQVASPTKFAEYLSAGLKVIISKNIGDYSEFVQAHQCGIIANGQPLPTLDSVDFATRTKMVELVNLNFTKKAQLNNYKELIKNLN
ncbi:MAG: hypothetical protein IPK10_04465 [Bacteroidetes bacterium]|nr:hypothetical protein [Bacteroidota bacterium]